ncbi:MAG: hypothetical protein LBI80_02215 [Endomicrobium sp.]|jgi:hypothetical protein|nr:hypothetical protein [Endomicrobium sp.]
MLKYKKIIWIFLLTIVLTGSGLWYYKPKLFQELVSAKKNFLQLSNNEILEDFDYLYTVLKSNSPLVCVAKRNGLNFDTKYKQYREKISRSNNNFEKITLIDEFSNLLPGHNGILLGDIDYWFKVYRCIPDRQTWAKILSNTLSVKNHRLYFNFKHQKNKLAKKNLSQGFVQNNNVIVQIIEPNKIAYIKIKSFENKYINDVEEKIIFDFYKKIKNYKHLIIDITGNSGGSSDYVVKYLLPIFKEEYHISLIDLFKIGNHAAPFIKEAFKEIHPINEFLKFNNLSLDKQQKLKIFYGINKTDIKDLTHYYCAILTIKPESQFLLKCKKWLLIDEKVFSASEGFTTLCKEMKLATIVGKTSRGDGCSTDPALIMLPNSKMIFRYSLGYGLNPDGTCSAEFGTVPDIKLSDDREIPLETCLRVIKNL